MLTASGDDLTASDDPTRKMMRQIAGAFAEYEKARLVSKLRHARERKKEATGKCEGRKSHDLIVQETGFRMLRDPGIELIAADSPTSFVDDTPTAALIRQVLGAVAQFEKTVLVAKLKGARDRKRRETGKCDGRKSHAELNPEMVKEAKRLRRASPKTGEHLSYRRISARLATAGYLNERGQPFNPKSIKTMVEQSLGKGTRQGDNSH